MKKFFDGKKSIVGAIIVGTSAICAYLGVDPSIVELIKGLGASLFGVGIAHKVQKVVTNK